jgi:signal transduction histidine kinase
MTVPSPFMRALQNLRVKDKITAITLFAILVVTLLSSAVFVTIESRGAKRAIVQELKTMAGIIADNSTAALVFDDPRSAEETLAALESIPSIVWARIYTPDGRLFARYTAPGQARMPPAIASLGEQPKPGHLVGPGEPLAADAFNLVFERGAVELLGPIKLDGERVGTIAIRSNLDQIAAAVGTYVIIALLVTLLSLMIAYLLISRLQGMITRPIEHLHQTMEVVSEKQDYSVRARAHGSDELGSLIDGFNRMLAQIQVHEESLRSAHQQAEAANLAKSEFLASMSHELRTPLNAILGFSEVMMREMVGPLGAPQYREYANDIHDSGRHLLDVINDILDISKIEAGRVELVVDEIDPGILAEKALRLVKDRAEQVRISLHLETDPDLPVLYGDERLVKQAVLNLLANAVKFTHAGGDVELRLYLDPDGTLVFAVRDNGIGIDEPDFERALMPFGQVESALTRNHQGTGLGLPLAKSFVELHGGELELESAVGKGTTVRLRFPAERIESREKRPTDLVQDALSA